MSVKVPELARALQQKNPLTQKFAVEIAGVEKIVVDHGFEVAKKTLETIEKNPHVLAEEGGFIKALENVSEAEAKQGSQQLNGIKNLLPHLENSKIDIRKLTEYALNPEHSVGCHKATVFERALGFDRANAEILMRKIYEELPKGNAVLGKIDQYGQRYTVDLRITGVNGNTATVRTGWILKEGAVAPELTTLYVK